MSSQNPYEQLGVSEASSFEEIQDARNRLCAQHEGDRKQIEVIESAYDAVLMDRLRLRQEGKIKVPDRIRFPEKIAQPPLSTAPQPTRNRPIWLQNFIDTPSRNDILLPAGILTALSVLILVYYGKPQLGGVLQPALILGVGSSFYLLFRKEKKLGKAVLLILGGLVIGLGAGVLLAYLLQGPINGIPIIPDAIATLVTFFVLWLIASFLR